MWSRELGAKQVECKHPNSCTEDRTDKQTDVDMTLDAKKWSSPAIQPTLSPNQAADSGAASKRLCLIKSSGARDCAVARTLHRPRSSQLELGILSQTEGRAFHRTSTFE